MKHTLSTIAIVLLYTYTMAQNYAFENLYPSDPLFYYKPQFPTGYGHKLVASADINGDGYNDIIKTGGDNLMMEDTWIAIYYGNCKAGLNPVQDTFPLIGINDASALEIVDYNLDNKPDILVCGNEQLHYYQNLGNGQFASAVVSTYNSGLMSNKVSMAIGDYNRDGYVDAFIIVVEEGSNNCSNILMDGNATGNFTLNSTSFGCDASACAAYDIDNDGWKDVALGFGYVYLSQPSGLSNVPILAFQGAPTIKSMFTILNSDADTNAEFYSAKNNILYYGKAIIRGSPVTIQFPLNGDIKSFTVDDFDKDGFKDDVALSLNSNSLVLLTYNNSTFAFESREYSINIGSIFSTDIDNNGDPDLFLGEENIVYRNHGGFRLSRFNDISMRAAVNSQTAADFDQDGYDDIAAQVQVLYPDLYKIAILFGSPCGLRETRDIICTIPAIIKIKTAYLNNDSFPDLVVCGKNYDSVYVALNSGNGDFHKFTGYYSNKSIKNFEVADFNEDGYDDVFLLTPSPSKFSLMTANSAGNGSLNPASQLQNTSPQGINVAADFPIHGDMNNDGHQDIILSHSISFGHRITVIYGDGSGNFPQNLLLSVDPYTGHSVDYCIPIKLYDDNYSDIAFISRLNNSAGFLCNDPVSGNFSKCYSDINSLDLQTFEADDINNDNIMDLVAFTAGPSTPVFTMLFKPDNSFYIPFPSTFSLANQSKISILDLNGDGKKDISTINFDKINIYENNIPDPPLLQIINDTIFSTVQSDTVLNPVTAYEWFKNNVLQPGFNQSYFPNATPGKFHLGVTYANRAYVTKMFIFYPVGLTEITENKYTLEVYPNPAHGLVNINSNEQFSSLSLENLQGQKIKETLVQNNSVTIHIGELPAGIYILKAKVRDTFLFRKLIAY